MRFSIRDLLWLMVVVALGATLYTDRVQRQRDAARWSAEKVKIQHEAAVAVAEMRTRADRFQMQNAILSHQLVERLEKDRQQEAKEAERRAAEVISHGRPIRPAPLSLVPDETE